MLHDALRPMTNSHEITQLIHLAVTHPDLTIPTLAVLAVVGGLVARQEAAA